MKSKFETCRISFTLFSGIFFLLLFVGCPPIPEAPPENLDPKLSGIIEEEEYTDPLCYKEGMEIVLQLALDDEDLYDGCMVTIQGSEEDSGEQELEAIEEGNQVTFVPPGPGHYTFTGSITCESAEGADTLEMVLQDCDTSEVDTSIVDTSDVDTSIVDTSDVDTSIVDTSSVGDTKIIKLCISKPDHINRVPLGIAEIPTTAKAIASISGLNGSGIINLRTGECVERKFVTPAPVVDLGANYIRVRGVPNLETMVHYGESGTFFSNYDTNLSEFGWETSLQKTAVRDVKTFDNDTENAGIVMAEANTGVLFFTGSQDNTFLLGSRTFYSSTLFDRAPELPVAVYSKGKGEGFLTLTDAGNLWSHTGASESDAGTLAWEFGADADVRQIECNDEGLCAISDFANSKVYTLSIDASYSVTKGESIDVGQGPLGMEFGELSSGERFLLVANYKDNTWSNIVFDTDGTVTTNKVVDFKLPCGMPAHPLLLETGLTQGDYDVVFSCNDTDYLYLTGYPPED